MGSIWVPCRGKTVVVSHFWPSSSKFTPQNRKYPECSLNCICFSSEAHRGLKYSRIHRVLLTCFCEAAALIFWCHDCLTWGTVQLQLTSPPPKETQRPWPVVLWNETQSWFGSGKHWFAQLCDVWVQTLTQTCQISVWVPPLLGVVTLKTWCCYKFHLWPGSCCGSELASLIGPGPHRWRWLSKICTVIFLYSSKWVDWLKSSICADCKRY